ncbi:hypothetical protein [Deinococcus petrolearius]|uniref:Uncharacterized protein n=1 Tax=Deinococcus petrolearius TaxID=1751295 RepID=A0ABW1DH32_9DEIO
MTQFLAPSGPTSTPAQSPAARPVTYEAPQVRDLGAWQALTLIYSVPFNGSSTMTEGSGQGSFGVWKNTF